MAVSPLGPRVLLVGPIQRIRAMLSTSCEIEEKERKRSSSMRSATDLVRMSIMTAWATILSVGRFRPLLLLRREASDGGPGRPNWAIEA